MIGANRSSSLVAFELLAHRIIWSVPTAIVLIAVAANWRDVRAAFSGSNLKWLALSGILIGANWLTYIWAVNADRAMEASLGYFINPLFSILLGAVILKEKLKRTQIAALSLVVLANLPVRKQVVLQLFVKPRIAPPYPFEHHGCVLFFFVAVVRENFREFFVLAGVDALVVPVNGFQLFHQRRDRAVHVAGLVA